MKLDLVIGETGQIESSDKDKLQDIASRVKDLNARLHDIRREQVFQRVRFFFSSSLVLLKLSIQPLQIVPRSLPQSDH